MNPASCRSVSRVVSIYPSTNWISNISWGLLLFLLFRITVLLRQREGDSFREVDIYAAFEIAIIVCSIPLVVLSPSIRGRMRSLWYGSLFWYAALYGLGIISVLWSLLPSYSGFRALQQLSQLLLMLSVLFWEVNAVKAERKILWACACCIVFIWIQVVKNIGFTFAYSAWHTNTYSISGAMLAGYCAGELMSVRQHHRRHLWGFFGLGIFAVAIGTSSSSNFALAIGLSFAAVITKYWKLLVGCFLIVILTNILALSGEKMLKIASGGKEMESIATMSGRNRLWSEFITRYAERPMLGEGFATTARLSTSYATNTHCSPLSIICGTGLFGGIAFLIFLFKLALLSLKSISSHRPFAIGCTVALLIGLINSLSCAFIGESYSSVTLAFNAFICFQHIYVLNYRPSNIQDGIRKSSARSPRQFKIR